MWAQALGVIKFCKVDLSCAKSQSQLWDSKHMSESSRPGRVLLPVYMGGGLQVVWPSFSISSRGGRYHHFMLEVTILSPSKT